MKDLSTANFDTMTAAEFEEYLPELFEMGGGKISEDPRFAAFFQANPYCAALVSDLETIAEQAGDILKSVHEPSEAVWKNIASKLTVEGKEPPPDGDKG